MPYLGRGRKFKEAAHINRQYASKASTKETTAMDIFSHGEKVAVIFSKSGLYSVCNFA